MKVLFAVNDENISTSIVKKYQKQYKEIISYKNVYYFNAILKELQRNKSYDRIVISEDLEEFTSSSFEQKDKFIFDRLDNISDDALDARGRDIPIILICSERRTKSEEILVKLFGIGIYNAILGDDRSTDEVCRLINKPRSKKEAKSYYKIDSENVTYEREKENEVSEIEMQNILIHFKKLGSNEDKYVESFKNIVSQYTEEQLRIIIAILPLRVKAILEEKSPEYQKLVFSGQKPVVTKKVKTNAVSTKKKSKGVQTGTSEKLLETNNNKKTLSKPVVVPTVLEDNMYKKVEKKKKVELPAELEDEDLELTETVQEKPKKRGRPRKNVVLDTTEEQAVEKPKKRGRPRKNTLDETAVEPELNNERFSLPGLDENETFGVDDDLLNKTDFSIDDYDETSTVLPGFDEELEDDIDDDYEDNDFEIDDDDEIVEDTDFTQNNSINGVYGFDTHNQNISEKNNLLQEYESAFNEEEVEALLTGDKKVVAFVGTSKNGTSFIVNNIAQILSGMGINTAILDATQNKSDYFIYTKNIEQLRTIAINTLDNLMHGNAEGIRVNNNLTVYTNIPNQNEQLKNSKPIIETIIRNHSVVLIDCDFETPFDYFAVAQELYLIQSMDVLTIQPLTAFLRELQAKDILDERKIRIILNKMLRIRGVNGKNIVGGMSKYNDPELIIMKELFNRDTVRVVAQIPFDEDVYIQYLENIIECEMRINGYPKDFKQRLNNLAEVIYPLLPGKKTNKKKAKKEKQFKSSFSSSMNNTLNNMKQKY